MILADSQKLVAGNIVEMFVLDLTALDGPVERYHNHNDGEIVWQGETYIPWAIQAEGFERSSDGRQPTPRIHVGNIGEDEEGNPISGVVSALCEMYGNLKGAKLIRKRTMAKYLDAVNFPDGNPNADPNSHYRDQHWLISRKASELPESVTFELASPLQFAGVKLPTRQMTGNVCWWLTMAAPYGGYRGSLCGYTGSAMYDDQGNPTLDPTQDKCGGCPSDCKLRFGEWNELRYGGFAAAGRYR